MMCLHTKQKTKENVYKMCTAILQKLSFTYPESKNEKKISHTRYCHHKVKLFYKKKKMQKCKMPFYRRTHFSSPQVIAEGHFIF